MSDCQSLGDCEDSRISRIYEYLDGALSCDDLAEIKEHLDTCPECAQEHDLECVIRSAVKRTCKEAAPDNLKATILERIHNIKAADVPAG
ncbi:mycothiol system anti-sigma-R factor [Paenarthrobacter sp. Z7-10]|uniref:mycothiol system anti-sigma-R factor n=1 Tax=Paenarthrobacter sp. Z7-10 TaxID=2787635 RepID=UPI0022A9A821|nr:mycothiol system anti-sigma-R factor [Paenarthrobacter sp. Z7-10]MCZ2402466.1 mycothiol system anti-sigma-R factor [Paenarthrobacter sp. Z7-10]